MVVFTSIIILIRTGLYVLGIQSMGKRSYGFAILLFTILGFPFLMEKARGYRKYCLYKKGKLNYDAAVEAIECSRMAYSNEGYALMQKLNRQKRQNQT